MGIQENKQIVPDFYDAGAKGDMGRYFALIDPQVLVLRVKQIVTCDSNKTVRDDSL